MTFVAAKRFGERIRIASDTMISDRAAKRHDVIPGRLKAVVLDRHITVAYAGHPENGIDAVRQARELLSSGGSISDVEQMLKAATTKYSDERYNPDFLIASHRDGVALKRIWDGHISSSQEQVCIGQRDLLSDLLKQESDVPRSVVPSKFEKEVPFSSAFRKLFNGLYVSDSVGGFGVMVTCSPHGHCYSSFGGVTVWDTIVISQGLTEQQLADRRSGMTQWSYNVSGPKLRGVGVVGAIILDGGIGYIYTPFQKDEPTEWRFPRPVDQEQHGSILEEFRKQIDDEADKVGGGIEVTFPPPSNRAPTEFELQQIRAHAAAAALPTQVSLLADGVWVSCRAPTASQGVRVDFSSLDPDPVWVLKTTIDRLNEEILGKLRQAEGLRE